MEVTEPPENEQVEPWGWGDKDMPENIRLRLALYHEFLDSLRGISDGD